MVKKQTSGNLALEQQRVIVIPAHDEIVARKLRVAAYARVSSSSEDQLNSYRVQNQYYSELISNNPDWEMVDIYADEGITGTSVEKREDFQRMMQDCRKGKIDRILVKSISRFARNTKDCLAAVRELKELGVSVLFEEQGIDTSKVSSEMVTAIMASLAQKGSESISENVRWGVQKRMQDGTYLPSSLPFGYTMIEKSIQIDETQAEIVREIYTAYLAGKNVDEIAEKLGITRRYVTQLLQPLVKEGTVKRAYMIDLKVYEKLAESFGDYAPVSDSGYILVNDMLSNMAKHVQSQLQESFDAVQDYDENKANLALEMDYTTNNMVEKVRTSVETIVSINQHSELSKSMLYNEVAYDLERIGDYCGHIAKFVIEDVYEVDEVILKNLKKMHKTAQKMIRSAMLAFLEGKTNLKDDIMDFEESMHMLQNKSINIIATQMAENSFDEKERSNYFMYLFRVVKAFERIGDISIEIIDVAIEFHNNIPRSTTPRTFR